MKPLFTYLVCAIVFIALLFLSEGQVASAVVDNKSLIIRAIGNNPSGKDSVYFVSAAEINQLILQQNSGYRLAGALAKQLNVTALEEALRQNPFVANCQVSLGANGKIFVDIQEHKPLARILKPDGSGCYVGKDGRLMPLSSRHTARTLPLVGRDAPFMMRPEYWRSNDGQVLLDMLVFIHDTPFWASMIAELSAQNGQISLLPQVGNQTILFGTAAGYISKFQKLELFYKKVLPRKGWSAYKTIDLAYNNQLVCSQ